MGGCALASGFSVNGGCVSVQIHSTKVGQPAKVLVHPIGHGARVEADVLTGARGSTLVLRASIAGGLIKVWGTIPADVPVWKNRYAHHDPVQLFGSVLRRALEARRARVEYWRRLLRSAREATAVDHD